MREEFDKHVRVAFLTLKEANEAITFMRAKLKESIGHWVSVYDLIGCCSLTPSFAYSFTSGELNDWGWTSIDGFSLEKSPIRGTYILAMPPARKRGMINPNLHRIMEEKYYPLTPPPEPVIGPKIVYPKSKYMDYVLNFPCKDGKSMKRTMDICKEICGAKAKLEVSDELNSYSYRIEPAPIKMPTREEIAASIKVYQDYNIDEDAYKLCYVYKDQVTDHTFHQLHVMKRLDHLPEDEVRYEMWDKAWREELISAVMKAHEAKKKELEKEKLKMYLNNSDAVYEKIYKYATNFEIESMAGKFSTATIECPVYNLNGLLGLEDDTAKKSKSVKSVEITDIEMYNDRVVKVTFDDGSFTKSVCQENDIFDLDVGITVCLMKKMLDDGKGNGTRIYNDIIRDAHKLINDKENEKIEKQIEKDKRKKKAHKVMMKKQAKKLKAKEEAIDIQKQAFVRALQETGMTGNVE